MVERVLKMNELIKKEISQIILKEYSGNFSDVLTTVTRVETSGNLIEAKVYISCIPDPKSKEVLAELRREIYKIQQELNKRLRIRPVPKIIFVEDKMPQEAEKIETILEEIKKQNS
ncbi:ribosome-binding factor A [Candidatus Parcubacteria bacterium A4]|nr:MAG: ribosome-binding factor A [Candidatus Parcubacteria bacterium A4]